MKRRTHTGQVYFILYQKNPDFENVVLDLHTILTGREVWMLQAGEAAHGAESAILP